MTATSVQLLPTVVVACASRFMAQASELFEKKVRALGILGTAAALEAAGDFPESPLPRKPFRGPRPNLEPKTLSPAALP